MIVQRENEDAYWAKKTAFFISVGDTSRQVLLDVDLLLHERDLDHVRREGEFLTSGGRDGGRAFAFEFSLEGESFVLGVAIQRLSLRAVWSKIKSKQTIVTPFWRTSPQSVQRYPPWIHESSEHPLHNERGSRKREEIQEFQKSSYFFR